MTKKPIDQTDAPADSNNESTEGAQKLQLSVKRMKKLRSSVKGGAANWTESVSPEPSIPPPGTGGGWTNNAEVKLV